MLLTKLEIRGFKSFGDRAVLNFDSGVTGVVGPNGSGKSNVVDAIRWVLGEQKTRSLRSDKMENVIFNGTKKRKPLQLAEASMTFENNRNLLPTEYSEVTITRRYYRSGDSEYLLNGVTCRLKDIQNLFMDTGIGPDSYAIIELKMVDDILNDQNQSRRTLFEEAAGVSKFKKRKKEAIKKLEGTDDDLERVEDLLHEIGKNLRSLERQAKQAERYLRYKEEYKKLSIALAMRSVEQELQKVSKLEQQQQEAKAQRLEQQQKITSLDAQIETQKLELVNQEKRLSNRQKTLNEHVNKIRQFESEKKIRNERLKYLLDKSEKLEEQLAEDKKSGERTQFSLEGLEREVEQVEKMFRETECLLEEKKAEHETQQQRSQELKAKADSMAAQMQSQQAKVHQLKRTVEVSEVQRSSIRQELEREASDSSEKSANLAEFDERITVLEEKKEGQETALAQAEDEQQQLEERRSSIETSLKSLQDEYAKASRSLDAKQNEYNLTKSMLDNLEGYPQAIQFLKKQTKWGKKAPLLSDVITCEEQYRAAIENFLEPYLSYYLLDDEQQAFEAISMLSDASKGKGNFMILSNFREEYSQPKPQFEHATPAVNLIECDDKYRRLAAFLFKEVYVVTANQEHLPDDSEATFVTQNGKVIRRPQSISGGSVGLFEGKKIGRAKNIEKLSKEIKRLEEKIQNLEALTREKEGDLGQLKAKQSNQQLNELRQQVSLTSQELVAVKTKKEQFASMISDSENKRGFMMEQLQELEETLADSKPKVAEEEGVLQEMEGQLEDMQGQASLEAEDTAQKSAAYNQQNILFHQQSNKLESLEKEIEYKRASFERGQARLANNQQELASTQKEIQRLEENSDDNEQEIIGLYEEKESIAQGVNEAEKEYYRLRGDINEAEKQQRQLQENRSQSDQVLMELQNQLNQTWLAANSAKERVSVEFGIDLEQYMRSEEGKSQLADSPPVEELEQQVGALKQKMDKMGAINHTAIEAYQEIKERNDFIEAQRTDLMEAKASLMQTIEEIDTVAKENFMDAFHQVRGHFIKVFRSLFTEQDSCDLLLLDPEDPLNSKIEILAQPKGKRPLSINQLSGGEKTLTATALLFSIYLLKPAPFCIFDEVDAPLDDANIDKFNNIIREFSQNSQFIIVTHNKRTMASTDIMYGITMMEQGVSVVVPVSLNELD